MDLSVLWFLLVGIVPWTAGTWSPSFAATWQLNGPENEPCLLLSGHFQITVPYLRTDGEFGRSTVDVPKDAKANGTCSSWLQDIQLQWPVPETNGSSSHVILFSFSQNGSRTNPVITGFFELVEIKTTLYSNPVEFPDAANPDRVVTLQATGLTQWAAPLELSYFCDSEEQIPLDLGGAYVTATRVQAQPFHVTKLEGNPTDFGFRSYCGADVQLMMTDGFLFIGLLFLISTAIAFFLQRQSKRNYYRPI